MNNTPYNYYQHFDANNIGKHRLPVRPIIRTRGVNVKKQPECIIDEPMIRPVVTATDLRALFGDDTPKQNKRMQNWKKNDYHCNRREEMPELVQHRVIEVPGEDLWVKLPLGVVCYRVEHHGFEYLLYLDGDTGNLKRFEKTFL